MVLSLITTAVWHSQSHDDVLRVLLLRIHRSLGVTVWFTTVSRLIWRMTHAQLPPFPDQMTQAHRSLVQISEHCLYALLVIQPLTGFGAVLIAMPMLAFILPVSTAVSVTTALTSITSIH